MLKNWIRLFFYNLKKSKVFSVLNLLGLSIGIAGLIFAILYYNDEHSYNTWNPEKDRVFEMVNYMGEQNGYWTTNVAPLGPLLKESTGEVEDYCYLNGWYFNENMGYNGKTELIEKILDTQNSFFRFFPFEFLVGNSKNALQENTIVLSETTAHRLFGDENPLNKEVQYSGRSLVVKGVYRIPGKSSYAPEAVTNLLELTRLKEDKNAWGNFNYELLLKLKNPANKDKVIKAIDKLYYTYRTIPAAKEGGITPEEFVKRYDKIGIFLQPLSQVRLSDVDSGMPEGQGNNQFLLIITGLSILILILSIVNYINMATASAIKRAKEVGVRKIIGATKGQIVVQFLVETAILVVTAIALALVLVEVTLPAYNNFLEKELTMQGSQFYAQLILIFVVVIVVAGIFPAIYVANFETLKVLRGNFGRSKSGVWLRNGMLVLQFAIASFFIIGSYIVYQQVKYMSEKDLGFSGAQVVEIHLRRISNVGIFDRYETLKKEIAKIPGVMAVSSGAFAFGEGASSSSSFSYHDNDVQGQNMAIDFGMLEMMKIELIKGRDISPEFASDTINTMLINQTAADIMKEKDPVGKEIDWNGNKLKIIGVVKDFNLFGLQEKVPPMAFFHFRTIDWMQYNMNQVFVRIDPDHMEKTIASLENFWNTKVDTEYPFEYEFVDKKFARTYQEYVNQRNLFGILNLVVILIALFGLFALASFSIERRMKEIAIRKTLGAETQNLLTTLSKQYIIFSIIGFAIALFPVYYLLNAWLMNFEFRITISVLPFVLGFVLLLTLTLAVVIGRAYQATRVDMLKYLKYE